jgi:DNA-binding response OmpR family regulator
VIIQHQIGAAMRPTYTLTGRVLVVESDEPLAGLYSDLIDTHCPGLRVDICRPEQASLIEDNAGGADVAVVSCGSNGATLLDSLRHLLTFRACLSVLVLIPADRPELADVAIRAGAADVLLRAPGYLDQIAVCVRKNVVLARANTAARLRTESLHRTIGELRDEICAHHVELTQATTSTRPFEVEPSAKIHVARSFAPARAA